MARPSLGHWWEFVRRLLSVLADNGERFCILRDLILGKTRSDYPYAAGLDAALLEVLEGKPTARATVRFTELFDCLVCYQNTVLLGHAAPGQLRDDFHERMAAALLAMLAELPLSFWAPTPGHVWRKGRKAADILVHYSSRRGG